MINFSGEPASMMDHQLISAVTLLIAVSVGIWWAANSIEVLFSKSSLKGTKTLDKNSWSDSFQWFELTALQHFIGGVVSATYLKIVVKKAVWPVEASKFAILLASLGNVVGSVAINAAYSIVSASTSQGVRAFEPLFMFVLSLMLYRDSQDLSAIILCSIVIMSIGASLFVTYESTFILSGLLAALCSNVAFPIRNIYLKKLSSVWESSFQKYAAISSYSFLIVSPFLIAKMIIFQSIAFTVKWQEGLISSVFHCISNVASIYVLQSFTPLTHAVFNLLKHGIMIVVNLVYFQLPLTWYMIIGLLLLFAGLYIYASKGKRFSLALIALVVIVGVVFSMPSGTLTLLGAQSSITSSSRLSLLQNYSLQLGGMHEQHSESVNQTKEHLVHSAWVFDRPISNKILSNLNTLSTSYRILVYCGTARCMQAIGGLSSENIHASFLSVSELVQNTPFEIWLAKHMFYKVLAMESYENHLQEVVRLAILWKYGGLYIEPNVQLPKESLPLCTLDSEWIGKKPSSPGDGIQHFDIACFPKQSAFIKTLCTMFSEDYLPGNKSKPEMKVSQETWNLYFSQMKLPEIVDIDYESLSLNTDQSWNEHYATLDYDSRVKQIKLDNVGDEIQDFPGLQFLPFIDNFLDRDSLYSNKNNDQHITAFFNAWWGLAHNWPPQSNVDPLLFSIHISGSMTALWKKEVHYLKAPVGCRDTLTQEFLTKLGVCTYFSGCLTLMMQRISSEPRTDEVLVVDVGKKYLEMLPTEIKSNKQNRITHNNYEHFNRNSRFVTAFKLIERYSSAKLVITQRIHTALPCVAMGTPVIFINSAEMPGGGGTSKKSSARTTGLLSMFHTLNIYEVGNEKASEWFANFPWDNPPPNPDMATMMRLRATFWYEIRKRPSLYDAGHKFGVVPMSPPTPCIDRLLFHIHFPHPDKHFTWQDHRSIESIFRHHPCASVLIHSNTLSDERFDVFRESGYAIRTQTYNYTNLFNSIKLDSSDIDEQLVSHSFLIHALILYKWGGLYMDSNIILTKAAIPDLPRNFIVWADSTKKEVDASFMRFEAGNKFLKLVATKLAADADNNRNSLYAQALEEGGENVETLNSETVFVFDKTQVNKQCYEATSGPEYDSWKKAIAESAVVVALSSDYSITKSIGSTPLKAGTLCRMLLYDFCVICSEIL